jgi:hypothetical protein
MDFILHILGICPDSLAHIDLMDIAACYYVELQNIFTLIKMKFNS